MKRIVTGILAHVDSGKTTLSEAILYMTGAIRRQGRVDHKNAFLDTNEIEREKGITIFSKEALFTSGNTQFTLLDTPGHIDFSAETERTLRVLDYCILVISGTDGVQSHTQTLWNLLEKNNVPTFVFINKMDISHQEKSAIMADISSNLSDQCAELSDTDSLVMCDEDILNEYLDKGSISNKSIADAIAKRHLFPCFFGSALKLDGVGELLEAIDLYTKMPQAKNSFGARIYKVSHDDDGKRLTHLKITGGELHAKDVIELNTRDGVIKEKVDTIRIYSGEKYTLTDCATQGTICAVTGLESSAVGYGLGFENSFDNFILEPVLTYKLEILDGTDIPTALVKLRILEQEEPMYNIIWNEHLREIHLQLMGEVQIEILRRIIKQRFNMSVDFSQGSIAYRETITDTVEGVGHFEPLRHYSEVHLLLEPLKRGQGIIVNSRCSEDLLEKNWQNLIISHIKEKTHLGVLTGSPITDIKITLVSGKAHKKHTEGGDFRQATYRAIRQGLMQAQSQLLEPYYNFRLQIPTENVGRAMTDLQQMGAEFSSPVVSENMSILSGTAPISTMREYHKDVISYTSGQGRLFTSIKGYGPCHNSEEVINAMAYNPDSDTDNPSSSVFCRHGAGFNVPWNEVENYMHLEKTLKSEDDIIDEDTNVREYVSAVINDEELLRIFEKTYGPIKSKTYRPMEQKIKKPTAKSENHIKKKPLPDGPEYLLVDGYNIIFAWDELKSIANDNLDLAREMLINRLCNFQGFTKYKIILVFDAYKVKGGIGSVEEINNISVVYTKEAETADSYIEKVTHKLAKKHKVRVATSDGLEQLIILGNGAQRLSASAFLEEIELTENKIREFINNM